MKSMFIFAIMSKNEILQVRSNEVKNYSNNQKSKQVWDRNEFNQLLKQKESLHIIKDLQTLRGFVKSSSMIINDEDSLQK